MHNISDFGKLDQSSLETVVTQKTGSSRQEVLQGPAFGVDTALIDLGNGKALAVASDPLSLIPSLGMRASAWLSVHLMANDIATTGFFPQYAQFVLNLPQGLTNEQLTEYWHYVHTFCAGIGVAITGGHTGIDPFSASTLAGGGTMFAQVDISSAKSSSQAQVDQHLIMTKTAALSSSAILARSFPTFVDSHLGPAFQAELRRSFYQTTVLTEIAALQEVQPVMQAITAMHDVTEGGVLGAIFELCEASRVGVEIDLNAIHVGEAQRRICQLFDLDPLRCIGAGSLLIACSATESEEIVQVLSSKGIPATKIGVFQPESCGKYMTLNEGKRMELTYHRTDPYWAVFATAIKNKLS